MIAIIDYGVGNIQNVINGFTRLGYETVLTKDHDLILSADLTILPGVGAFNAAMEKLIENDMVDVIKKRGQSGKPLLGICLGMQLLFDASYENGFNKGLGLIKGEIVPFKTDLKVPHMGWNKLNIVKDDAIVKDIDTNAYVYYVHSFYLDGYHDSCLLAYSDYDAKVPGIVRSNNIIGMQFHPEKSGEVGLQLLTNLKSIM